MEIRVQKKSIKLGYNIYDANLEPKF